MSSSWQQKIIRKQEPLPPRVVIYGAPGCGKTTFGASLPNPILLDADRGADLIQVDRLPGPGSWAETVSLVQEFAKDPGDYKSLVLDTIDQLEDLAELAVCEEGVVNRGKTERRKSISEYDFGQGYDAVAAKFRVFLAELDQVRAKGILICLLGHSIVRTAQDPTLGDYEEFASQTNKKVWAEIVRWADFVGYATFDAARVKDEKRAIVTTDRVLYTQRASGVLAKNRFSLPPKLPFAWRPLADGIAAFHSAPPATAESAADIILRVEALATALEKHVPGALEKTKGYMLGAKMNPSELKAIEEALKAKLSTINNQPAPQATA